MVRYYDFVATHELSSCIYGSRAWQLLYDVFRASKPHLEAVASTFDLTPQQMLAIRQLERDNPLPMSALASMLGCDASNVTSIVDRLEARGLVERRSADRDRRVKALVMTAAGVTLQEEINRKMQLALPPIANLSPADQETLCRVLERALASLSPVPQ